MSGSENKHEPEVLLEKVREFEERKAPVDTENTALLLREAKRLSSPLDDAEAKRRMRAMSRRGFLIGGAAAVFGYLGYSWLKEPDNSRVFEGAFKINEGLSQDYF